ncbi:UNVERIFIED_CONTAM: hypothetical protein Sindi_0714900 [Sesamum indicum]
MYANPIGFQVTYSNRLQPQKRKEKVPDAGGERRSAPIAPLGMGKGKRKAVQQ